MIFVVITRSGREVQQRASDCTSSRQARRVNGAHRRLLYSACQLQPAPVFVSENRCGL